MVGHIMRLAAYLSASRHGIFCFRWPIPAGLHPEMIVKDAFATPA